MNYYGVKATPSGENTPSYYYPDLLERYAKETNTPYWMKQHSYSTSKTAPTTVPAQHSGANPTSPAGAGTYPSLNAMGAMKNGAEPINPNPSAEFLKNYYHEHPSFSNPLDIGRLQKQWAAENPANIQDFLRTHNRDTGVLQTSAQTTSRNTATETGKAVFGAGQNYSSMGAPYAEQPTAEEQKPPVFGVGTEK